MLGMHAARYTSLVLEACDPCPSVLFVVRFSPRSSVSPWCFVRDVVLLAKDLSAGARRGDSLSPVGVRGIARNLPGCVRYGGLVCII